MMSKFPKGRGGAAETSLYAIKYQSLKSTAVWEGVAFEREVSKLCSSWKRPLA